jgi:hypothetical protein
MNPNRIANTYYMVVLHRLLLALIFVRVLMPPGICFCQLTAPAVGMLAGLIQPGQRLPQPPDDHHDDHHSDGCPCSPMAAGLGLKPAEVPPLILACSMLDPLPAALPACEGWVSDINPFASPPPPDLFQSDCALLL